MYISFAYLIRRIICTGDNLVCAFVKVTEFIQVDMYCCLIIISKYLR